ncbi:MAG: tetratricopeptide repeat protein [Burkholderiales bacterium]
MDLPATLRGIDFRGCEISGASPAALESFERALAAFQCWRIGAEVPLAAALQDSPAFVMAHVLQAWQCLATRDPASVRSARPILDRASRLPANARERLHLAAIAAVLADDYERAKTLLGEALLREPRDALALQIAHGFDYLTGDIVRLGDRAARVLPAWSSNVPGYHAVLAMHAFGLGESGDYAGAERFAREALALDPLDARAHHALAHVFEMTQRFDEGVRWMSAHVECWAADTVVATHCWWHLALFHLALGHSGEALRLYDTRVRPHRSDQLGDMIDASALLWRIDLAGGDPGGRWRELASAWSPRIGDGFCTFNDLHAMLAFVGAHDWDLARRLEHELAERQALRTRHGETTRRIGLPAARALIAFGHGDCVRAVGLLASLFAEVGRIGGSHAQRDVLHLTLLHAVEHFRRHAAPGPREYAVYLERRKVASKVGPTGAATRMQVAALKNRLADSDSSVIARALA